MHLQKAFVSFEDSLLFLLANDGCLVSTLATLLGGSQTVPSDKQARTVQLWRMAEPRFFLPGIPPSDIVSEILAKSGATVQSQTVRNIITDYSKDLESIQPSKPWWLSPFPCFILDLSKTEKIKKFSSQPYILDLFRSSGCDIPSLWRAIDFGPIPAVHDLHFKYARTCSQCAGVLVRPEARTSLTSRPLAEFPLAYTLQE